MIELNFVAQRRTCLQIGPIPVYECPKLVTIPCSSLFAIADYKFKQRSRRASHFPPSTRLSPWHLPNGKVRMFRQVWLLLKDLDHLRGLPALPIYQSHQKVMVMKTNFQSFSPTYRRYLPSYKRLGTSWRVLFGWTCVRPFKGLAIPTSCHHRSSTFVKVFCTRVQPSNTQLPRRPNQIQSRRHHIQHPLVQVQRPSQQLCPLSFRRLLIHLQVVILVLLVLAQLGMVLSLARLRVTIHQMALPQDHLQHTILALQLAPRWALLRLVLPRDQVVLVGLPHRQLIHLPVLQRRARLFLHSVSICCLGGIFQLTLDPQAIEPPGDSANSTPGANRTVTTINISSPSDALTGDPTPTESSTDSVTPTALWALPYPFTPCCWYEIALYNRLLKADYPQKVLSESHLIGYPTSNLTYHRTKENQRALRRGKAFILLWQNLSEVLYF